MHLYSSLVLDEDTLIDRLGPGIRKYVQPRGGSINPVEKTLIMEVVYEVNVLIDNEEKINFLNFLEEEGGHVEQLLALPYFLKAQVTVPEPDDSTPDGKTPITAVYWAKSREALQQYFDNEASAMREDTMKRFGGRISATRRILAVRRAWG